MILNENSYRRRCLIIALECFWVIGNDDFASGPISNICRKIRRPDWHHLANGPHEAVACQTCDISLCWQTNLWFLLIGEVRNKECFLGKKFQKRPQIWNRHCQMSALRSVSFCTFLARWTKMCSDWARLATKSAFLREKPKNKALVFVDSGCSPRRVSSEVSSFSLVSSPQGVSLWRAGESRKVPFGTNSSYKGMREC